MNICPAWRLDSSFPGRAWPDDAWEGLAFSGLWMHLFAIRVQDDGGGVQVAWEDAFAADVCSVQRINGASLQTVELPGLEGDWIVLAHPHGD